MKRSNRAPITAPLSTKPSSPRPTRLLASSIAVLCGIVLLPSASNAQTWNAAPATNNWNTATNWTPINVPDAPGETASFGASTITSLTVTAPIDIAGITFNAAAPAYTITNSTDITILGAGIVNGSAAVKTISTINGNSLTFDNSATAGNIVLNNTSGGASIDFLASSTAGSSTINNLTALSSVNFFSNATLGTATINNSGGGSFPAAIVFFFGNSTAASGTILNSGNNTQALFGDSTTAGAATITNSALGSSTLFSQSANAGTATITNSGANSFIEFDNNSSANASKLFNTGSGSLIEFYNSSTAGTATITNSNATGIVNFFDTATAGASTINNSGGGSFPAAIVAFFGNSQAGTATINNSGANTQTLFSDSSSALNSRINNTASGASSIFTVSSTAANSVINNSGADSFTTFSGTSTAGASTINNSGSGALIEFSNTATGGTAILNNTNSTGLINFLDSATAGAATINNSGGGAFPAAIVGFFNNSRAGSATINNSGANTQTLFSDSSSALTARVNNTGSGASSIFIGAATAANALIANSGPDSFTNFSGTSTAGASTINNSGSGALVEFFNTSTAGSATLNNSSSTGLINFFDTTTAGTATINNSGSGAFPAAVVSFFNNSRAGDATINNSGSNTQTVFSDFSSAGTAAITNGGTGSSTLFAANSTAANAAIDNSGDDSFTSFIGNSKAANATITNSGSGSTTDFADNASAGQATITSTDSTAIINFLDNSTAANATINNNGGGNFPASLVGFFNSATAATAKINNIGDNTQTLFSDVSTAANSVITNSGAGSSTLFIANATAGNSKITNSGANSFTEFNGSSTAANATLSNNGSAGEIRFRGATTAGGAKIVNQGNGSRTLFGDTAKAATSTITNSGAGSSTVFTGAASGDSARIINANATSAIDISQLTSSGTTLGSIEGNGSLSLGSKKLTVGSINLNTTFSGDIKNGGLGGGAGGSLVKVGTGTLTLTGANTFTGGTTLQAGSILVGSSQALGNGDFTLTNGTLGASGDTRDINVRGNYTQTGGTVQFRVGGAAAGQYDRLAITGKATLAGRLSVKSVNGFNPQADNRFFVVTAAGGVTGQFAEFDDQLSQAALKLGITYDANNVILEVLQSAFLPFARTPNQRAVARALDRVVNDPNAVNLVSFLDTLPAGALPGAFDRIAPEEFGAIFEISRSSAKIQAFSVQHRLDEIHAVETGMYDAGLAKDGKSSAPVDSKGGKDFVSSSPRRFGVWANGNGEFVSVGSTSNARGYDFDSGGFTLGLDYRFNNHFAAGVLFNYTRTDAQLAGNGSIESDAIRGGIYASVFGGGAYLNGYIGAGTVDYDTRRQGLQGTPRGSTDGTEFNAFVSAGYDKKIGGLTIGPIASYQYTSTDVDSFRERGSLAPLRIASMDGNSSRTNLGARASYDWHIGSVVLAPEIRASWQHEFGDVEQTTDARLAFGGPTFSTNSARVGRDSFQLATGFSLQITPDIAAYAFYEGELGRSNYDAHNIVGGVRANF